LVKTFANALIYERCSSSLLNTVHNRQRMILTLGRGWRQRTGFDLADNFETEWATTQRKLLVTEISSQTQDWTLVLL